MEVAAIVGSQPQKNEGCSSLETTVYVHNQLARAEGIPVIGFLTVSPLRIGMSIVEIIAGLAAAILFGVFAAMSFTFAVSCGCGASVSEWNFNRAVESFSHAYIGFWGVILSVFNVATLGVLGACDGTKFDQK